MRILKIIMTILRINTKIELSDDYIREGDTEYEDMRNIIHPKVSQTHGVNFYDSTPYPQVFDSKMPFEPNLSEIDSIFKYGGV
jgi:hypothetical protein